MESLYTHRSIFDTIVLEPPRPISKFYYRCDKQFLISPIEVLYEESKQQYGIIKIYGDRATWLLSNEFGECKTIHSITARINKKHCKGGQSQNRIQRLREETIHSYLSKTEQITGNLFTRNGLPIIKAMLIVGVGSKKDDICKYINIDVPTRVLPCEKTASFHEHLLEYIQYINTQDANTIIDRIQGLLDIEPDLLVFGKESIVAEHNAGKLNEIYTINKIIEIPSAIQLKHHVLESFGGIIGIRYYVPQAQIED